MQINIYVFSDLKAFSDNRKCFGRSLSWESNISFPFEKVSDVLRVLFGLSSIINIVITPL